VAKVDKTIRGGAFRSVAFVDCVQVQFTRRMQTDECVEQEFLTLMSAAPADKMVYDAIGKLGEIPCTP